MFSKWKVSSKLKERKLSGRPFQNGNYHKTSGVMALSQNGWYIFFGLGHWTGLGIREGKAERSFNFHFGRLCNMLAYIHTLINSFLFYVKWGSNYALIAKTRARDARTSTCKWLCYCRHLKPALQIIIYNGDSTFVLF